MMAKNKTLNKHSGLALSTRLIIFGVASVFHFDTIYVQVVSEAALI